MRSQHTMYARKHVQASHEEVFTYNPKHEPRKDIFTM